MHILTETLAMLGKVLAGVGLILALLNCFFGYRLQRFWIALAFFVIGIFIGKAINSFLPQSSEPSTAMVTVAFVIIVVCGVVLAALSFKLYLAGVFVLALFLVFLTCTRLVPSPGWLGTVLGVVVGVGVALLAVKFTPAVMILVTAISGGFSVIHRLEALVFVPQGIEVSSTFVFVGGALLAVAGIFVQQRLHTQKKRLLAQGEAHAQAEIQQAKQQAAAAIEEAKRQVNTSNTEN